MEFLQLIVPETVSASVSIDIVRLYGTTFDVYKIIILLQYE